jgi:hypothetical protein
MASRVTGHPGLIPEPGTGGLTLRGGKSQGTAKVPDGQPARYVSANVLHG